MVGDYEKVSVCLVQTDRCGQIYRKFPIHSTSMGTFLKDLSICRTGELLRRGGGRTSWVK